jgi:hypothetical protein
MFPNFIVKQRFIEILSTYPGLKKLPLWLLVFLPAIWMGEYIRESAVNVPCLDDWENVPMLKKWYDGTLGWSDLWSLQIQHRPVIPRLMVIALTWLGQGDMRWQHGMSFALNLVAAVLLAILLRRTLKNSLWLLPIVFLSNCLLFSPILYQNFFWATLFWMAIPGLCMVAALLVLEGSGSIWTRFFWTVLLALAATFSFSHGLVLWPVIGVFLLINHTLASMRQRIILFSMWASVAVLTLSAYFHDFRNQSFHAYELQVGEYALGHTVNLAKWENFSRVVRFAWGLIGNGFARSAFESEILVYRSQLVGGIVFFGFCVCAGLCLFTEAGRRVWSRALPWFTLGSYGLAMALAVAVGRAHLGEHRCTVPRYFVGTLYLSLSLLVIAFLLLREFFPYSPNRLQGAQRARYIGVAAVTSLIVMQWPLAQYGMHLARVWNNARHQAAGVLTFINFPHLRPWSINTLDNTPDYCRTQANTLHDLNLLRTQLAQSTNIHQFKKAERELQHNRADVDEMFWRENELVLKGHARFGNHRPADVIMVTVERYDDIVGLGVPRPRPQFRLFNVDYEFTNFLPVSLDEACLWEAHIPLSNLPENVRFLEVWALDSDHHLAARFDHKIELPRRPAKFN